MRILIGYDGSRVADAALKDLSKAGLPLKAQACILVAVAPIISPQALLLGLTSIPWYPEATAAMGKINEKAELQARSLGGKAEGLLKKRFPSWSVSVEIAHGDPAGAILEKADAWKPDLIVLGSRGLGLLGRALLGSVAQKVLGHAHGNVRIGESSEGGTAGVPRVLIGFDGSRHARAALAEVARRTWPRGTEARLVAILDPRLNPLIPMPGRSQRKSSQGPLSGAWPRMEERLKAASAKLAKQGLRVTVAILQGEPRRVLLKEAKAMQADCIFLGSKGHTGFQRLLLGSVASGVAAHAECPVEIIRKLPGGRA